MEVPAVPLPRTSTRSGTAAAAGVEDMEEEGRASMGGEEMESGGGAKGCRKTKLRWEEG